MQSLLFALLALLGQADASPDCTAISDCYSCAKSCSWCHRDNRCHGSTFVNLIDPCFWHDDDIKSSDKCPDAPKPNSAPLPSADSKFAAKVLGFVFKKMGIDNVNLTNCVSDVGNSEVRFRDFAMDLKHKKYKSALEELGRGMSALANSVTTCGVKEVQQKIDAMAAAVKFANISTSMFDWDVKVLVGASDLWKDVAALQAAVEKKDPSSVGDSLAKLLDDWTSIEGGCKPGESVCQLVDGLLRVLAVTAKEVTPCEEALTPALTDFHAGSQLFKAKDYKKAIAKFAAGLDVMAEATKSDACGLKHIADAIGKLSPKLSSAIVKIENSTAVKIIVGSGDLYDSLYRMVTAFERKDYAGVGVQLGWLLAELKATTCQTKMCLVVEGLLGSLQVGFTDFEACSSGLDKTWLKMENLTLSLEKKQWKQSLLALGDVIKDLGDDVNACGVKSIGSILNNTASQLHLNSLAADLGVLVQFLVKGADITPDIQKLIVDIVNKQWAALGSDLGTLSTWIASKDCHTFTCKLMEGILNEADITLTDLKPCEDTLREAEHDFVYGAEVLGRGHQGDGLRYWAAGLNQLAKSTQTCGLPKQLAYLEQEANVLALGNITGFGKTIGILVHGSDIYEEIFAAWQAFTKQDYRTAGAELQKVVFGMYKWTTGHLCTSDACYIFSGMLQYLSDLSKDIKKCGNDFKDMLGDFKKAYHQLTSPANKTSPLLNGFTHNKTAIESGIVDISKGIALLADSVGDCHLADLVGILKELAVKLGASPVITVTEEVLKILIEGVNIEHEIANALEDFATHNWAGFGYNLIKLVKSVLANKQLVNSDAIVI